MALHFSTQELAAKQRADRSEEHTSELQSHHDLVCRLLLEKKKKTVKVEECSRLQEYSTMRSSIGFAIQRSISAIRQEKEDGWLLVCEIRTLAVERCYRIQD